MLGNAAHFHAWLSRVEAARGRSVYLVETKQRWNDLAPHVFTPKKPNHLVTLYRPASRDLLFFICLVINLALERDFPLVWIREKYFCGF